MKKSILLFSLIALAASCNMDSPDVLKQQITRKQEQVQKINEQIAELEDRLEQSSAEEITEYLVPVSLKNLIPETFDHYIEVTGRLEAEEDAFISPEMNGQIKEIHVLEGQAVTKGQLLVSLNTAVIESNINEVKTGLGLVTKLYERQKELWDQNIGSEVEYLQAKNAMESAQARLATLQAQLDMALIEAPFNGIVESIMLKEGELAAPGMQLIQLVSLNTLKLYGNISERYLTSIHKGDEVIVILPDAGGISLEVPVFRVGNVIDEKSRTFMIELKIDNRERNLKPNMFTIIRINDFSSDSALVVPSIVIKQDLNGSYVYVAIQGEGSLRASKRYITTGLSYNDQTMVAEGLEEGQEVIIQGFDQVSDGVRIVER